MMKRKSKLKKILIPVVAVVLVATIGLGVWRYVGSGSAEPVNVYPFDYLGMTEYWADSQESYGPVTTDKIQTVYVSETQTITEIHVNVGDTVKKGDLLMTYDTTLSDLALERERLEVEKLKLRLEDARKELTDIKNMKPMATPSVPEKEEKPEVNLGTALGSAYQISSQSAYDGSAQEKALICWIGSETAIDDTLFEAVRQKALEYQAKNAQAPGNEVSTGSAEAEEYNLPIFPRENEDEIQSSEEPTTEEPTVPTVEDPTEPSTDTTTEPTTDTPTGPTVDAPTEPSTEPTQPQPDEGENNADSFYVVFKMTQGDMSLGQTLVWQGMLVTLEPGTNTYRFTFFDASGITDHMLPQSNSNTQPTPDIDYGSGYTSAQIAQMRSEQEKTIKDLEFQIKMAEAEYKIKQTEVSDGKVLAEIDGEVVSLLDEEEAKLTTQPMLKVSGGGGFHVEGSVSELEKDNLQIGQEVTINDWNTGMVYNGTIQSIGDTPSADGYWNGMGNPNASYYPFDVFIDGSADLQSGSYVNVTFSSATAENGIYLENPFLRTEEGKSYVYVRGEDGTLEQRFVTTGKSLWGSYTEILEGITEEDLIAFPYGKNVKSGAETKESDMSELYGY